MRIFSPSGPLRATLGAVLSVLLVAATLQPSLALARFRQVLSVVPDRPLELAVSLPHGDLEIFHGRDEQVAITVSAQTQAGQPVDDTLVAASLAIEQAGNRLQIRYAPDPRLDAAKPRLSYRIDVPHWSRVDASVGMGKLTILGVMGPVRAAIDRGAIRASYISRDLSAEAQSGDLQIDVVGGRVSAKTGSGNILCARIAQGVSGETDDGDIALAVVGPSEAIVRYGTGKIDIAGARGSLKATTLAGDLHVRAVPHDHWDLKSESGNIRVELPLAARFELNAAADSGQVLIRREDVEPPATAVSRVHQKINGGGQRIDAHSRSGKIVVQ